MTIPERRRHLSLPFRSSVPGPRWWTAKLPSALLLGLFVPTLIAATLCAPAAAQKQKPYALIYGTVFSADGRVVYGVPVKVRRADKKKTLLDTMSDHSGEFAFRVPPGPADYIVWADLKPPKKKPSEPSPAPAAGPQAQSGMELKVHVDADERVDISLHLPAAFKPY